MTSSYTTNLGIEKIATGDQSGTWGDTTNTNFDILDQAVNGILSLTLASAGSSGSPTDIPVTDGAVSNGRNKFIELTETTQKALMPPARNAKALTRVDQQPI